MAERQFAEAITGLRNIVSELKDAKNKLSLQIALIERAIKNLESQQKISTELSMMGSSREVTKVAELAQNAILALSRGLLPHELDALVLSQAEEEPVAPPVEDAPKRGIPAPPTGLEEFDQPAVETPPRKRSPRGEGSTRRVGMAPMAKRFLRVAFSEDATPGSIEDIAKRTWDDDWQSQNINTPQGKGNIISSTLGEDLDRGSNSILRRQIGVGVERLQELRTGKRTREQVEPGILVVYDLIDTNNRWEELDTAVQQWGIGS